MARSQAPHRTNYHSVSQEYTYIHTHIIRIVMSPFAFETLRENISCPKVMIINYATACDYKIYFFSSYLPSYTSGLFSLQTATSFYPLLLFALRSLVYFELETFGVSIQILYLLLIINTTIIIVLVLIKK